jgi:hypothetical protein
VNKKDGQLLIRINSAERDQFLQLCETMDTSAARELRKLSVVLSKNISQRILKLRSNMMSKQVKSLKQKIK